MLTPIQTRYAGHFFRSRLEARWAVFFDAMGIVWEYEKEGYDLGEAGWYLPDFWLPEFGCFVEIKGAECSDEDASKCRALHEQSGHPVFIAKGQIGDHAWQEFGAYIIDTPVPADQLCHHTTIAGNLVCPVCGNEYVRFGAPTEIGTDIIKIPLDCEEWHWGQLRLVVSKGLTNVDFIDWVEYEHLRPEEYWAKEISRRGGTASHANAINAARSARFEHGESGAR